MPSDSDKGKGRASESSQSPFEPEQPRRGPQVGSSSFSRTSQDDAKRRLIRTKSPNPAATAGTSRNNEHNEEQGEVSSHRDPASQASTPTVTSQHEQQRGSRQSSATMQAMGSQAGSIASASARGGYLQQVMHHQHQRIRIREDLTKQTSFDRARDGDELYNLWVGPP